MTEFSPIGQVSSTTRVHSAASGAREDVSPPVRSVEVKPGDRVELSDRARFIAQLRTLPEVRSHRVESAKAAINDPTYLSENRLHVALGRMLEDLDDAAALEDLTRLANEQLGAALGGDDR